MPIIHPIRISTLFAAAVLALQKRAFPVCQETVFVLREYLYPRQDIAELLKVV